MLQKSLVGSLWMYGTVCGLCGVAAMLLPYETRGREMPVSYFVFFVEPQVRIMCTC